MLLKFKIEEQLIRCTNYNTIVSDSVNFISASFLFDEVWTEYVKTITFTNITTGISKSILLDQDSHTCFIPWEVIQDDGEMEVYVEGTYNGSIATTASMKYPISIIKSGKNDDEGVSPTPDIYRQIMDMLSNIQSGIVSPDAIATAIENYFVTNPLNVLYKDNTQEYIPEQDYNPATKKYVDTTVSNTDIIKEIKTDPENHLIIVLNTGKELDVGKLPTGNNGMDGKDGEDGVTPHIDANTKHWFIGDVDTNVLAEGVNGKDGEDGAPGIPGTDGIPGKDGIDGISPHIDQSTKHWFVGNSDTGIIAEGRDGINGKDGTDGEPGKPGAPGKDGINGITPHIGSNKHWFIGESDTGVVAEGKDGIKGVDGADGVDGAPGIGVNIGSIILFTGNTTPPANFLACDGNTYNIADYPELTQHFTITYQKSNQFGGDGTTTFAVPDLSQDIAASGILYCIRYK